MRTVRLGDVALKIGSGATPRGGSQSYKSEGIALVRSQNVLNAGFEWQGLARIDAEQARALNNVRVEEDDVLLNITGEAVARACQVPSSVLPARVNQHVAIVRPDPSVLDPAFLRYWLIAPATQMHLAMLAGGGATRKALTKRMIEELSVPLLPLANQRAVATVLGDIDAKIELNHRMIASLDDCLSAMFRSWFVNFVPIGIAKLEKTTGRKGAQLGKFELSAEGVPEGWRPGSLKDITSVILGGDWGTDEPTGESTTSAKCIRGADIPSLQRAGLGRMPTRYLKASSLNRRRLMDGDIVIEVSGGSPTQSTGRAILISRSLLNRLDHPVVCSNFCRLLRVSSSGASRFVYLWLRELYKHGDLFQFESGTTGIKNFAMNVFADTYPLLLPKGAVLDEFDRTVAPFLNYQQMCGTENDTLADLRTILLPRLVSGELGVRLAERMVAAET